MADVHPATATLPETTCADCGRAFAVPTAEAAFFLDRGLATPDRCPACRAHRRAERNGDLLRTGGGTRYSLNDHGTFGGVAPVGAGPRGGPRGAPPGPRFSAVCADCGTETTVPFEPRRGRPVYCKPCFDRRRG